MSKVTVYTARKVRTMDPGRPEAEAIAVLGGRVLSTGTLESMDPWLSRYDVTVDDTLKDKVILPGFIEPHTHFWMSAGFMALDFVGPIPWPGPEGMNPGLATADDIIARLRQLDAERDPKEPIIAWGFDPANQGGSFDRRTLDAITSKRPIWIIAWAPHFGTPGLDACWGCVGRSRISHQTATILHDVRHTQRHPCSSKAGVPVKVVSEGLGHGNPAFTIDTYQHVLPGMQAEAARIFESLIASSR